MIDVSARQAVRGCVFRDFDPQCKPSANRSVAPVWNTGGIGKTRAALVEHRHGVGA